MWFQYILFFFVALGAKLVLALITIYLLLPADARCSRCDGDTLLIRPRRLGQMASRLLRGRLQWRWCPLCGEEGMARRRAPEPGSPQHSFFDPATPTRR